MRWTIMLIENIDKTVIAIIKGLDYPKIKNIYNHKKIIGLQKESVHLSFRFYNNKKEYYIFTLLIQLKEDYPLLSLLISRLKEGRHYFNVIKSFTQEIPKNQTAPTILLDQHLMTYCKNNKHFPEILLIDQYKKVRQDALNFIQTLI